MIIVTVVVVVMVALGIASIGLYYYKKRKHDDPIQQIQSQPSPNLMNQLQQQSPQQRPQQQSNVLPSDNLQSADYNVLPNQPYGVVMYNTESGEIYVPPGQTPRISSSPGIK